MFEILESIYLTQPLNHTKLQNALKLGYSANLMSWVILHEFIFIKGFVSLVQMSKCEKKQHQKLVQRNSKFGMCNINQHSITDKEKRQRK